VKLEQGCPLGRRLCMKILFVTPELYPFAKTGGLADYSSSGLEIV